MKSGIYQILNKINGKRYIGSTIHVVTRLRTHERLAMKGVHENQYFQNAVRKYGIENFSFEVIELCEKSKLIEREQFWIDSYDINTLYNISQKAGAHYGYKHTAEAIEKFKPKNRVMSDETKKLLSLRLMGNTRGFKKGQSNGYKHPKGEPAWNKGTVGVMKAWNKGKPRTWESAKFDQATYEFISPDGKLFTGVGVSKFAKEHGLRVDNLSKVRRGKKKHYKGWRLAA